MAPVAPDELDRLLARLDGAAHAVGAERALGATGDAPEAISVELVVHAGSSERSWFVAIDEDGGRAARGPAPDPTVVVRIDESTFDDLRSGTLDVQRAI